MRVGDGERTVLSIINEVSAQAQYTFIGLRPPLEGEDGQGYADYFKRMRQETADLRTVVFSLAANGIDFKRIYRE